MVKMLIGVMVDGGRGVDGVGRYGGEVVITKWMVVGVLR